MSTKFAALLSLIFIYSLTASSQKNMKPARVVMSNSDTIAGLIDYGEWLNNPSSVLFTTDKNKPASRYGVNELSYFEVTGLEQFKRYTVRISLDNDAITTVAEKDTSSATRTVFLKILQTGKNLSLFSYRDELKRRLYLLDSKDSTPQELLNSVYMVNNQVNEEKQYRHNLLNAAARYLPGDGVIILQINNAGYYHDVIGEICSKINGIEPSAVSATVNPRSHPGWRFFIGAGINNGSLVMFGANLFTGQTTQPFYYPVGSLGADLVLNPASGKLIIRGQLQVTGYKTDAYHFVDYTQYTEQYVFKFRQVNIAFEPQLLYNLYNQKNLKWYVSAGIGFNFSKYPENSMNFTRTGAADTSKVANDSYVQNLRSVWLNGFFTTGVDLRRLELSFHYFTKADVTQTPAYGLSNQSIQLRVSFYLKK